MRFRHAPAGEDDETLDARNATSPTGRRRRVRGAEHDRPRGRTVLRLCTINPRTTDADIDGTVERIAQLASSAG